MKQALVTGATGAVGRALLQLLGPAGWQVMALQRGDPARAAALCAAWRGEPGALTLHACDPADAAALPALLAALPADYCPDVIVHLAAPPLQAQPLHRTPWEQYQAQLAGVLELAVRLDQPLLRRMIRRGSGRIIGVLTQMLHGAPPRGFAAYTTAKYALAGYFRCLAAEYAGRGIAVNTVSPGAMNTPQLHALPELLREQLRAANPGGWVDPAAVARAILWLADGAPAEITGCDVPVPAGPLALPAT